MKSALRLESRTNSEMKTTIGNIRKVIKEAVAAGEFPKEGDTFVQLDGEGGLQFADVYDGGDLSTTTEGKT